MSNEMLKNLVINWLDLYVVERKKDKWGSYTGMALGFIKSKTTGQSDEEKKTETCEYLKTKVLLVENTDGWIKFIDILIEKCDNEPGLLRDVAHAIRNHIVRELREYDIWPMPTTNPLAHEKQLYEEKNRIYIKKNEKGLLEYTLITPETTIVTDTVKPEEVGLTAADHKPLTMDHLRKIFRPLLKITAQRKHTRIKDPVSFNAFHDVREKLVEEKEKLENEHRKIQFENFGQEIGENQQSRLKKLLKLAFLEDWESVNKIVDMKLIGDERIGKKDGFLSYKQHAKVHEGWPLVLQPNTCLLIFAKEYWLAAKCLYESFMRMPRYSYLPPPSHSFQNASFATFISSTTEKKDAIFSDTNKVSHPSQTDVRVSNNLTNPGGP